MFKELGQMASLLKQAKEMQGRMGEIQQHLQRMKIQGSAGAGMVTVEMNGLQQVLSCHIDPTLFQGDDQEMVEDLIVAATNQAMELSKTAAAEEMGKMTQGMDMGGLKDILGKMGMA